MGLRSLAFGVDRPTEACRPAQSGPLTVSFDTSALGAFSQTIRLAGVGSNASGFSGAVDDVFLTLNASVVDGGGGTVPEPGTLLLVVAAGAAGFMTRRRRTAAGHA